MTKRPTDIVETSSKGEFRICCPFCADRLTHKPEKERVDTGYHLYANRVKNLYHCHRCGKSGKASTLEHYLGAVEFTVDHWELINNLKDKHKLRKTQRTYLNLDTVSSPVSEGTPSWQYLTKERGLTPQEIRYYDIRSGRGEMTKRVIVPVFDEDGNCIYYSGRQYVSGAGPKYKNPQADKKSIVFNLHRIPTDYVIICEGMFSAIHAGKSAVAVLGKYISSWQFHAIARRWKKIYLALDGGVFHGDKKLTPDKRTIPKIVSRFQDLGCSIGVVELPPNMDPEDVGQETFQKLVVETQLKEKEISLPQFNSRRFYSQ